MTSKNVSPEKDFLETEKDLLEKAATTKRFEYLQLGKELKAQTDIATKKKTVSKLDNTD